MESFPYRLKDLITSATILKVGVNIGADMKKLCRDFGTAYAARGVLDLSHLARAVDVGLVGTKVDDLDTSKASLGVGIPKNLDPNQAGDATDANMEDELSYDDNVQASTEIELETPAKKGDTNRLVRSGRKLISLARLVRRYLARELEKGDVRTNAANDAHAGLALYYALQRLHSRSVKEGVIPVPSPPPWKGCALQHDMAETYFSEPRPAPPPFGAQATNRRATPGPNLVPLNELQHLTPIQLESLIPWDSLIKDLQAEFEEARALVLVKRKKEGVDLHGRGEAVVAAEEAALSLAHTSDSSNGAFSKNMVDNPLGNAYFDSPQPRSTRPQGKGMAYEIRRRKARQATQNEVLGRQWPPTRVFPSRSTERLGLTPPSLAPTVSHPISGAEPSPDSDQPESQPQESTHPPIPSRGVSSPALSSGPRPQHLRAYLLWHKQQLPLPQICASLRSASYPLAKSTAISYIVQALQADEKLPFEATRLRDLMSLDTTSWVRENYKQFLESKIGCMDDNAS
ncbi:unnamed protein product [Rhizoctonia solani]|uniref:Uncharacterized protein n=1 Tax=Rhizoctonia solani TaxID=456999 RepID=A0A8H3HZD0_9AGAM|nr:unnamed protein product [Rhizoctonia solani]